MLEVMTQEDKDLLIKDLCARFPYGVKFKHSKGFNTFEGIVDDLINPTNEHWYNVEDIKPYLFPMSSMTEKQKKELANIDKYGNIYFKISEEYHTDDNIQIDIKDIIKYLDWLNTHHFDYRGLIEKGLAINATNLNIY